MTTLLGDAGRAALKAFASSLLILAPGVAAAPDLNRAVALGIAALMSSIAAAAAAFQVFVPDLSFREWIPNPWGAMLDSFLHAFLGAFLTSVIGILNMPDLSAWKSLVIAAIIGAVNAGLRALQGMFTVGERPAPRAGVRTSTEVYSDGRAAHAGTYRAGWVPA